MNLNKIKINLMDIKNKVIALVLLSGAFFVIKKIFLVGIFFLVYYLDVGVNYELFFFFVFSFLAILSAVMIFLAENPVHSILYMVVTFLQVSFLMLLLGAEFLALMFIIVYVGAISMLFLFVIMMLDIRKDNLVLVEKNSNFNFLYNLSGFTMFFLMGMELYLMLVDSYSKARPKSGAKVYGSRPSLMATDIVLETKEHLLFRPSLDSIAHFLYTHYFFYLVMIGIILLIPMIGAIVLTFDKQNIIERKKNLIRYKNVK